MGNCCTAAEENLQESNKHGLYKLKSKKCTSNLVVEEPENVSVYSSAFNSMPNFANKPTKARRSYEMEMVKSVCSSRKESLVSNLKQSEVDFYSQFKKDSAKGSDGASTKDKLSHSKTLNNSRRKPVFVGANTTNDEVLSQFVRKHSRKGNE